MCEIEYCIVLVTHRLGYVVLLNSDSSTLGSTRFCFLIAYKLWSFFFFFVNMSMDVCLKGCTLLCVMCVIVLYCTVLYSIALSYLAL